MFIFFTNLDLFCIDNARVIYRKIQYYKISKNISKCSNMFWITRDPSSGSFIQCLGKITVIVLLCPLTFHRQCLSSMCSTHTHHGVSPILYFHYIYFLYMSCCFDLNLILNQTHNLSNYSKYAAIIPTTSISTR